MTPNVLAPTAARLRYSAQIAGAVEELTFTATAIPDGDFETNRCGFCILHPIVGLAGSPVSVEHTDGSVVETVLPELIDPWQPFKDMRAITHTVRDGLTAECRMEGDTFEMEDQRNWSDASYKTYVRPLALALALRAACGQAADTDNHAALLRQWRGSAGFEAEFGAASRAGRPGTASA